MDKEPEIVGYVAGDWITIFNEFGKTESRRWLQCIYSNGDIQKAERFALAMLHEEKDGLFHGCVWKPTAQQKAEVDPIFFRVIEPKSKFDDAILELEKLSEINDKGFVSW